MTLSEDLTYRGLIKDTTFQDINWLNEPKTFYLGVDGQSSDSLQVGNLAVFMLAYRMRLAGWKAVLLVGGATSLIGDPGGKGEERELKTLDEINHNVAGLTSQVARLFSGQDFVPVNNYDWFKDIGYLEFLREVGKHFSMTELVQRDFISTRMGEGGSGISYAEFSYNLIQGYDYWHLYKTEGAVLQIGGSDQWGNMLSGAPLIRKKEGAEVHALSMPLIINKSTGQKFGKSEGGAVWLDPAKTSVYKFYQFWLNVDDESVEDYLKVFTLLGRDEIDTIAAEFAQNRGARLAQRRLAQEVTRIVHGQTALESVERITAILFGDGKTSDMQSHDVEQMKAELPTLRLGTRDTVAMALVGTSLAGSNGEARRLIEQGGVRVNGEKLEADRQLSQGDTVVAGSMLLKRGKNQFAVIDIAD